MSRRFMLTQTLKSKEITLAWLLLLPLIMLLIVLLAYPFLDTIYLSFCKAYLGYKPKFVGMKNYITLIQDPIFRLAFVNTCIFTVISVILKLAIGMGMALALNQRFPLRNLVRGLLLLPWITPGVVSVLTWRWMLDSNNGLVNYLLQSTSFIEKPILWLSTRQFALLSLIIVNVWRGSPFFGISILASLQTIPEDIYEVAKIDGANIFQRFFYITMPFLKPITIITTVLSTIWTFNDFLNVWVLTQGGPFDSTHVLATYSYKIAFLTFDLGKAAAIAVYALPLLIGLVLILIPYVTKGEIQA